MSMQDVVKLVNVSGRVVLSIPIWGAMWVLRFLLIALGWIFVSLAAICGAYHKIQDVDGSGNPRIEYHFTWRWMWLWDNWEDGIMNDTYWRAPAWLGRYQDAVQIIYWSALRNPVNNLRVVRWLSVRPDPADICWVGTDKGPLEFDRNGYHDPEWFYCWAGVYSCIWIQFKWRGEIYRYWTGWKLFPYDMYGITGHRTKGCGFTTQLKRLG